VLQQVRLLGGRYEMGELLGRGATGEVRLGRDLRSGRPVAVKALRADLAREPLLLARFRREITCASSLHHAAIVAVHDAGVYPVNGLAIPYMVMEYVDGKTLRALLHRNGGLPPRQALRIVAQTLHALEHSHRNGIVHRDIKPGNVMLTATGAVKVMDWGIARTLPGGPVAKPTPNGPAATNAVTEAADPFGEAAEVIGTPQYLSPEQATGSNVDCRSDLYSVGCLMYELLTGRPPFTGEVPVAVVYQHVRENPTPPSQVAPGVPVAVDEIVLKALIKNPDHRYQTAADMLHDVECRLERITATSPADKAHQ
jgi:serine/threonine-protein kinase